MRACASSSPPAKASLPPPPTAEPRAQSRRETMLPLTGKNVVVIGGSRGVGRQIVAAAHGSGASVLAVARQGPPLSRLADEFAGCAVLALDATEDAAPGSVFEALEPDVLVICAGAFPPAAPLHQLGWREFSANWEADVRI